jgi:hypothetical protein
MRNLFFRLHPCRKLPQLGKSFCGGNSSSISGPSLLALYICLASLDPIPHHLSEISIIFLSNTENGAAAATQIRFTHVSNLSRINWFDPPCALAPLPTPCSLLDVSITTRAVLESRTTPPVHCSDLAQDATSHGLTAPPVPLVSPLTAFLPHVCSN